MQLSFVFFQTFITQSWRKPQNISFNFYIDRYIDMYMISRLDLRECKNG